MDRQSRRRRERILARYPQIIEDTAKRYAALYLRQGRANLVAAPLTWRKEPLPLSEIQRRAWLALWNENHDIEEFAREIHHRAGSILRTRIEGQELTLFRAFAEPLDFADQHAVLSIGLDENVREDVLRGGRKTRGVLDLVVTEILNGKALSERFQEGVARHRRKLQRTRERHELREAAPAAEAFAVFSDVGKPKTKGPHKGALVLSRDVVAPLGRGLDRLKEATTEAVGALTGEGKGQEQCELRPDPRAPRPSAMAEQAGRAAQVRAAVGDLPEREREVVGLSYFQHCSNAEIADRLGLAEQTVRNTLTRALARLRDVLPAD